MHGCSSCCCALACMHATPSMCVAMSGPMREQQHRGPATHPPTHLMARQVLLEYCLTQLPLLKLCCQSVGGYLGCRRTVEPLARCTHLRPRPRAWGRRPCPAVGLVSARHAHGAAAGLVWDAEAPLVQGGARWAVQVRAVGGQQRRCAGDVHGDATPQGGVPKRRMSTTSSPAMKVLNREFRHTELRLYCRSRSLLTRLLKRVILDR